MYLPNAILSHGNENTVWYLSKRFEKNDFCQNIWFPKPKGGIRNLLGLGITPQSIEKWNFEQVLTLIKLENDAPLLDLKNFGFWMRKPGSVWSVGEG